MIEHQGAHAGIRTPIELGGQRCVAVGFLEAEERSIACGEAMRRVASNSRSIVSDRAAWDRIWLHRVGIPEQLRPFSLATFVGMGRVGITDIHEFGALRWVDTDQEWLACGLLWFSFSRFTARTLILCSMHHRAAEGASDGHS